MHLSSAEWVTIALSFCGVACQAAIIVLLRKKNLKASFPTFYAYNLYSVGAVLVLDTVYLANAWRGGSSDYFYLYWALNAIQLFLQLAVMYEAFVNILKPYSALIDLGKMLFRWAAIFLAIAAALSNLGTSDAKIATRCMGAVQNFERGISLMQFGLLLLFFIFEKRLSLSWRSYSVVIGFGLGASTALTMVFSYLREYFSTKAGALIDISDAFTATCVVGFWVVCFSLPELHTKTVLDSPRKLIFQRWNDTLLTTPFVSSNLAMASVDSFLPNVERTVERVMARKMTQ